MNSWLKYLVAAGVSVTVGIGGYLIPKNQAELPIVAQYKDSCIVEHWEWKTDSVGVQYDSNRVPEKYDPVSLSLNEPNKHIKLGDTCSMIVLEKCKMFRNIFRDSVVGNVVVKVKDSVRVDSVRVAGGWFAPTFDSSKYYCVAVYKADYYILRKQGK